jgi:hypothetical protein
VVGDPLEVQPDVAIADQSDEVLVACEQLPAGDVLVEASQP